jgi:hypothetical protein
MNLVFDESDFISNLICKKAKPSQRRLVEETHGNRNFKNRDRGTKAKHVASRKFMPLSNPSSLKFRRKVLQAASRELEMSRRTVGIGPRACIV